MNLQRRTWLLVGILFLIACGQPLDRSGAPDVAATAAIEVNVPEMPVREPSTLDQLFGGGEPTAQPAPEAPAAQTVELWSAPPACPGAVVLGTTEPRNLIIKARFKYEALEVRVTQEGVDPEAVLWVEAKGILDRSGMNLLDRSINNC